MSRYIALVVLLQLCAVANFTPFTLRSSLLHAQGFPYIRNFTAAEYGAHNRNFDIEVGADGTIFVANFEGLLYYDRAQWHIIHTPDISRVTVVYRATDNTIWVGGYNFFARLQKHANGELYMKRVGRADLFRGEVMEIFENEGALRFVVSDNNIYEVKGDDVSLKQVTNAHFSTSLNTDIIETDALERGDVDVVLKDIIQTVKVDGGLQVMVKENGGLIVADNTGRQLYTLTESNGLCSDQVSYVAYDGYGLLWGATAHGIFAIELSSPYTFLLPHHGLAGEVHAIADLGGTIYIGGNNGLYRMEGNIPVHTDAVSGICWALVKNDNRLYAATSTGIRTVNANGTVSNLTSNPATAVFVDSGWVYAGEQDGLYLYKTGQPRRKICELDQVTRILRDADGSLWLQNVFGEVWHQVYPRPLSKGKGADSAEVFKPYRNSGAGRSTTTLVDTGGKVTAVGILDTIPFPYPAFSYTDDNGVTWLTDQDGKHLYQWQDGKRLTAFDRLLSPVGIQTVNALWNRDGEVWIGGDDVLTIVNTKKIGLDTLYARPRLLFRSIVLGHDSVVWGGYGDLPSSLPHFASDERHLRFVYALDHALLTGSTLYRYRLNNDRWSAWTSRQTAEFLKLPYGNFTLSIQARLANGEETDVTSIAFSIDYPLLIRWYMNLLYILLACGLIFLFFRLRLKKLRNDKLKLEKIVNERTAEVVSQKESLERALDELHATQNELLRQERMASIGKLTQGLIDRILNPMNYITNFSKLSQGLVKDIKASIEDNKEAMNADDYEDTADALDMLTKNLQTVDDHGQSTTRTLKAMEELLKEHSGGRSDIDLLPILRLNEQVFRNNHASEIGTYGIKVSFSLPATPMMVCGNADQLSKAVMNLLTNAIYAVVKKSQRQHYDAAVLLTATESDGLYKVKVHDNGIGIEATILDKVFDPFFTTKTTGEASGTGLYLSREIVQNHGGDITVESVKDKYSEFTITLPVLKEKQ